MADATRSIELIFEGVDNTAAAVQSALKNTEKFASSIQSATQPIADFTVGAAQLEAGLIAAGLAVTTFAVKVASDFDAAFREISTLIQAPVEDLDAFRGAILDYAATSSKPLEEVTQSIYNAISAGVDFADSIEVVAQAEKLSVAGKAALNDSLLVLVSSLNAYGLGMENAERFSDLLFQTVKSGQTTLPELSASLADVTSLAATTGISFEELLAAIATITSTGTPTSQAITQIKAAISAILGPTDQAQKLAKELGLEFNAERLQAVGLAGVLAELQEKTGGSAEKMLALLGSSDALVGVLQLTGLGAEKFAETIRAMGESAGSTGAAFDIMSQSLDLLGQKIQNSLQGVLIAIGDPLLDEAAGIADAVSAIFSAIGDSIETGKLSSLVEYLEKSFQGLQETLSTVAKNLPAALEQADLSGFTDGLDAIKAAIGSLFDNLDLTSTDGLANAITAIGDGFNLLSRYVAGAIESLGPLFDQVTGIADGLLKMSPELARAAGELGGFVSQANLLAGAFTSLVPSLEALIGLLALRQGASLVGSIGAAAAGLSGASGLLALLGQAGLVGAAGAAGVAVGGLGNKLSEVATGNSISTWLLDVLAKFGLLDDGSRALADGLQKTEQVVYSTGGSLEDLNTKSARTGGSLEDIGVSAAKSGDMIYNFSTGLWEAADAAKEQADGIGLLVDVVEPLGTQFVFASDSVGTLVDVGDKAGGTFSVVTNEFSKAAAAARNLAEEADKISLQEKLALIESQTKITVAQIEADAQRIDSAFDSVNVTLETSANLLGDLYGLYAQDLPFRKEFEIQRFIEQEQEIRAEALEIQKKLLENEIRRTNAQIRALEDGKGIITINGDGLQPHLEAFMFAVLEAVQIKTNSEGLALLLGTG